MPIALVHKRRTGLNKIKRRGSNDTRFTLLHPPKRPVLIGQFHSTTKGASRKWFSEEILVTNGTKLRLFSDYPWFYPLYFGGQSPEKWRMPIRRLLLIALL